MSSSNVLSSFSVHVASEADHNLALHVLGSKPVSLAPVRLYVVANQKKNKSFPASAWQFASEGLVALTITSSKKKTNNNGTFFQLLDPGSGKVVWKQQLYIGFKYFRDLDLFHTFEADKGFVAFVFGSEKVATDFFDAVTSLKIPKLSSDSAPNKTLVKNSANLGVIDKSMISRPKEFRHVSGIQVANDGGFVLGNIPGDWQRAIELAGITHDQLKDKKIRRFIFRTLRDADPGLSEMGFPKTAVSPPGLANPMPPNLTQQPTPSSPFASGFRSGLPPPPPPSSATRRQPLSPPPPSTASQGYTQARPPAPPSAPSSRAAAAPPPLPTARVPPPPPQFSATLRKPSLSQNQSETLSSPPPPPPSGPPPLPSGPPPPPSGPPPPPSGPPPPPSGPPPPPGPRSPISGSATAAGGSNGGRNNLLDSIRSAGASSLKPSSPSPTLAPPASSQNSLLDSIRNFKKDSGLKASSESAAGDSPSQSVPQVTGLAGLLINAMVARRNKVDGESSDDDMDDFDSDDDW